MDDLIYIREIESIIGIELKEGKNFGEIHHYLLNNRKKVRALNLNNCKLQNIDSISDLLSKLTDLRSLSLDNNQLSSIGSLNLLHELTILSVANNKLSDITIVSHLPNLDLLDAHGNVISNIDPLKALKKLIWLNLSNNKISDITPISNLHNLVNLNFKDNIEIDISTLEQLPQLKELRFGGKSIYKFEILKKLTKLKVLEINSNQLSDITFLNEIPLLEELTLSGKCLKDISPVGNLINLRKLSISNELKGYVRTKESTKVKDPIYKLADISIISNLTLLENLSLNFNKIQDIAPLANLLKLKELSIHDNLISDLTPVSSLKNLTKLYLKKNKISNLAPLDSLFKLKSLLLYQNEISDITPLKELKNLRTLGLDDNNIDSVPQWVLDYNMKITVDDIWASGTVSFSGNPINNPPLEILKKGKGAIKRYFKKIDSEGTDFIFETKLTLVGEGSAGKTSLQRRLINDHSVLPNEDKRTRGIEIVDWEFQKKGGEVHLAHIWDFGGQDVYYPVHRFFITENSVFVLLASTRQTAHNFDYWIPTIYQFGGKSPIIIGQTCHDGNKVHWNDLGVFLGNKNFNIIKTNAIPYYELNLKNDNDGLSELKETIINQLNNLPHYGKGVPRSWVPLRKLLFAESLRVACITFENFGELCRKSNERSFSKKEDIVDCCQFLHDIGIVLWYASTPELKDWVILQPGWAMNAVYKIIDDEIVQGQNGNILDKDFTRLWDEDCYKEKHDILKKMLKIFKIAFPKKHRSKDYIIPARLLSMPNDQKWDDTSPRLRLEYNFEFMPRGLVNQVSAELSRYIPSNEQVWNNAVNLSFEGNRATCQIVEDFYNRKISISCKGKDARGLIVLVMDALKNITSEYKGVDSEIFVPCICQDCKVSKNPTTFPYNKLLNWSEKRDRVTCNESEESLMIEDLLHNVGLTNSSREKDEAISTKTISLFLASSSELKEERDQFEIFINRENKVLNNSGIFIKLELWEDFIDKMSKTRLQDEYNRIIEKCDIFLSLFSTKVGRYTAEEFEVAFGSFKDYGKPLIYTYFKNTSLKMNDIKEEDISSKFKFQSKLKTLGHFPTMYEDINDLKFQFKKQLEKIIPLLFKSY